MWWHTVTHGRASEGKLANAVGSQYPSHYLGTWCIQHYYSWCAHLGCQQSTELTPPGRFKWTRPFIISKEVDSSWNVMAHGDAREGKWRGNWRMQLVASTLHTTSEHVVSSITNADAHTSAASSRLNWRPPADLNGVVRFPERWNLVSARVPSHFNWPLPAVC